MRGKALIEMAGLRSAEDGSRRQPAPGPSVSRDFFTGSHACGREPKMAGGVSRKASRLDVRAAGAAPSGIRSGAEW